MVHRVVWFGWALAFLAGCQGEDTIRDYSVEHKRRQDLRLVAAITKVGDATWFFRLSGPAPAVQDQMEKFEGFLQSFKFDDAAQPPIAWKTPEGWVEVPGRGGLRFGSFYIAGTKGLEDLELTIFSFKGASGSTLDNVNRWRKQIQLPPVDDRELAELTKRRKVDGREVTLIDIVGMGEFAPVQPPMREPRRPTVRPNQDGPFQYKTPDAWQIAPPAPFSVATFTTAGGVKISLSSVGGDLIANLRRWREDQVGLPPVDGAELLKSIAKVKAAGLGIEAAVVDFANPARKMRIVGAVFTHDQSTWYLKMSGPVDAVGLAKADFDAFLQSLKMP